MVTTIQLEEELKLGLDKLKIHPRESYNELIKRIISVSSPQNASRESLIETIEVLSDPEIMRNIGIALKQKGGKTIEELEKELKLNV
jgi:uncharacterized protein YjgD (DUF1641 family)